MIIHLFVALLTSLFFKADEYLMLKVKRESMSNFQNIILLHLLLRCGKILAILNFTSSQSVSLLVGCSKNMELCNPKTCVQVLVTS